MRKHLPMVALIVAYIISTPILALGPGGAFRVMRNGSRFCRWTLRLLGIKVTVRGKPQKGLLVSNHLSYVDILTILALHPCRFVTFTELGESFGIGFITKLSQSLFVHRSKPSLVHKDIAMFEAALSKAMPFAFFPEGSSFDGSKLYPFKAPLFESAIRTKTPIQPICLRYTAIDGEAVTLKNRDKIYFHGDMKLIPQLLGILRLRSISIEVVFCDLINSEAKTRKELASLAHLEVSKHFLAVKS